MIKKYVQKPVIIEAVQWTGKNTDEIREFCGYSDTHMLEDDCYIVKEASGKFNLYSKSAFHATYERHLTWEDNI